MIAKVDAEADTALEAEKLVDRLTALRSRTRAEQLAVRHELEQKRLAILEQNHQAQLAAQQAELERFRALLLSKHRRTTVARSTACSAPGRSRSASVGQQLAAGAGVARVAGRQTQSRDLVETGQDIAHGRGGLDTRNGTVPGVITLIRRPERHRDH
jgi:hypothetical protein